VREISDHARQCVDRTGRKSANLGRKPDPGEGSRQRARLKDYERMWKEFTLEMGSELDPGALERMPDYITFNITYEAAYSPESLRAIIEVLRATVLDNWTKYGDPLSWPPPDDSCIGVESLLERAAVTQNRPGGEDTSNFASDCLFIPFSPLAMYVGWLFIQTVA
jgi:hypothetical protein